MHLRFEPGTFGLQVQCSTNELMSQVGKGIKVNKGHRFKSWMVSQFFKVTVIYVMCGRSFKLTLFVYVFTHMFELLFSNLTPVTPHPMVVNWIAHYVSLIK